ncbi:MAG: hypothetical protein R2705_25320 [Ilumatobacteraceae bacterium]
MLAVSVYAARAMSVDSAWGRADPYSPRSLVQFAINAHLDGRWSDGRTRRQAFAGVLGITEPGLVARLSGNDDKLLETIRDLELHGFAEPQRVMRLARQRALSGQTWDVSPGLWPLVRNSHRLGLDGVEPALNVLCPMSWWPPSVRVDPPGDARAAVHRVGPQRLEPRDHLRACEQLIDACAG